VEVDMRRIRVIKAVLKKYIINMFRYPTWIIEIAIWPLIAPLMYILAGYGMAGPNRSGISAFSKVAGTDHFVGYIIIGQMIWMWANMALWSFGSSLRDEQMKGTLEANWLCPIHKFDLMIGNALGEILFSTIMIIVSIVEYRFLYQVHFTGNLLTFIVAFAIFIPAVYGFSLVIASLVLWIKEVGPTVQLVRGLITVFCGVSYPVILLPKYFKVISDILPFTHGINAARYVLLENGSLLNKGFYEPTYTCLINGIILFIAGRLFFMMIEKKVRQSGSLERF
jgi:ABC-2 type transport system permease protein